MSLDQPAISILIDFFATSNGDAGELHTRLQDDLGISSFEAGRLIRSMIVSLCVAPVPCCDDEGGGPSRERFRPGRLLDCEMLAPA